MSRNSPTHYELLGALATQLIKSRFLRKAGFKLSENAGYYNVKSSSCVLCNRRTTEGAIMILWQYQTLIVRQGREIVPEVTHVNSKEAVLEVTGRVIKSKSYHDLPSYLARAGRKGWEVVSMAPATNYGAGSTAGEGANDILIVMKRPLEAAESRSIPNE